MAKLRVEGYSVYLDDADERAKFDFAFAVGTATVSYTHLTLPTILLV